MKWTVNKATAWRQRFAPYVDLITACGLFTALMLGNVLLYYGYGTHHSSVPLLISGFMLLVAYSLAGLAAYRIHRRRDQ